MLYLNDDSVKQFQMKTSLESEKVIKTEKSWSHDILASESEVQTIITKQIGKIDTKPPTPFRISDESSDL